MNCRAADSNDEAGTMKDDGRGRIDEGRRTMKDGQTTIRLYLGFLCYFFNVLHQLRLNGEPPTNLVIPRKRHRDLRPAVAERRA